jgi:hypothetical protein
MGTERAILLPWTKKINVSSMQSLNTMIDIDKYVDLDAVNKITGLGAAYTPNV